MGMKIGIVGLGLIGASLAKAIEENTEHTVYGFDIDEETMHRALEEHCIDGALEDYSQLDLLIVALFPNAAIDLIRQKVEQLKEGCIVMDICGKKRSPPRWHSFARATGWSLSAGIRWRARSVGDTKTRPEHCFGEPA